VPFVVDFLDLDLVGLAAESFFVEDLGVAPFAAFGVDDEVIGLNFSFFVPEACGV
jgi:hypothetical protein